MREGLSVVQQMPLSGSSFTNDEIIWHGLNPDGAPIGLNRAHGASVTTDQQRNSLTKEKPLSAHAQGLFLFSIKENF